MVGTIYPCIVTSFSRLANSPGYCLVLNLALNKEICNLLGYYLKK